MSQKINEPFISIYQCFPDAPIPRRAERSLFGTIPLRAYTFCEPLTAASGFGFWVFPPIDFELLWDGSEVLWKQATETKWKIVESVVLPGFSDHYYAHAPQDAPPHPPAFLSARRHGGTPAEPGIVQIWTGLLARTHPDWAILFRSPANLTQSRNFEVYEGIVETDWWFGPLVSNIRLCRSGFPILFRTKAPLFQLQPIPKSAYSDELLDSACMMKGLQSLAEDQWKSYTEALTLRNDNGSGVGGYKAAVAKHRLAKRSKVESFSSSDKNTHIL